MNESFDETQVWNSKNCNSCHQVVCISIDLCNEFRYTGAIFLHGLYECLWLVLWSRTITLRFKKNLESWRTTVKTVEPFKSIRYFWRQTLWSFKNRLRAEFIFAVKTILYNALFYGAVFYYFFRWNLATNKRANKGREGWPLPFSGITHVPLRPFFKKWSNPTALWKVGRKYRYLHGVLIFTILRRV